VPVAFGVARHQAESILARRQVGIESFASVGGIAPFVIEAVQAITVADFLWSTQKKACITQD
jgi:hypothetical protein